MACEIKYGTKEVPLNNSQFYNSQFYRLLDLGLEVAKRTATAADQPFVARMQSLDDNEFWPGRGIDIEADFPDLAERKFWCRVFLDTARAICDRSAGHHEHQFWQALSVWQAYRTDDLFHDAVRVAEPRWEPDTLDGRTRRPG